MENNNCYSITTKRFVLYCNNRKWLENTQSFYNDIVFFYYQLFLNDREIQSMSRQNALRAMEQLTVLGKSKIPVPYPLPWEKVPLYFRRAAINASMAAAKSHLAMENKQAGSFRNAVTYYKGMYRDFTQENITLKVWDGIRWRWMRCRLSGNQLPEKSQIMSPSVVIRKKQIFFDIPIKTAVSDGRKAENRIAEGTKLCCLQFTNVDTIAVCVILDCNGKQTGVHFIKGGVSYANRCLNILNKIEESEKSGGNREGVLANKKYWEKIKNIKESFSNYVSRQIINICIKEQAGFIIIPKYREEYTQYVMNKVGKWSALYISFRIREQLKYKAWKEGILLMETSAAGISSVCAICGSAIQKDKQDFVCINGHRGNRFLNSALNMGRKFLKGFGKQIS